MEKDFSPASTKPSTKLLLKLSSIPDVLLKDLRPQSEIEDLMSSTLHELSKSKGGAPLCMITYDELHLYLIYILLTQSPVNLFKIFPQILTDLIRLMKSTYWVLLL